MSKPSRLQLVIAFHEPLSRNDDDLEKIWEEGYAPFISRLGELKIKAAVHFTGHLLDHLAHRREDQLLQIKRLVQAKQFEVLGGLFYGGIPSLLPEVDVRGQVQMMTEYWESVIGKAPQGVWLPELAWCAEVPRLLADTGLAYGFVASSQIALRPDPMFSLVVVERGDQSLPAFMLDSELSAALANSELMGWQTRVEALAKMQGNLVTVWISAGALVEAAASDTEVIDRFFDAFSNLAMVLPQESFALKPRASAVRLHPGVAPELCPTEPRLDFDDFAFRSRAVDSLSRRMLRVSKKLYEAISSMEDEELEERWSDVLATAQRAIFAAQSPDPYVHSDDAEGEVLRAAAIAKLIHAESLIDSLVQGSGDWLVTEEEDADSDLHNEVFVGNRYFSTWISPVTGGDIRSIDDRINNINLLVPIGIAPNKICTVSQRILDPQTSANIFFNGQERDLLTGLHEWVIKSSGIDEQDNCAYHIELETKAELENSPRILTINKQISIPIDAAELRLNYKVQLDKGSAVLLALDIPIRLPNIPNIILYNDNELALESSGEFSEAKTILFNTDSGSLKINILPAYTVWFKLVEDRIHLMPIVKVNQQANCSVCIIWKAKAPAGEATSVSSITNVDLSLNEGALENQL
ncbi:MAG: hypothetical protein JW841_12890 [Deltaproteobacteria bacterium]|nr:hypothetical protein [Deltaproteobacteria bacterium]